MSSGISCGNCVPVQLLVGALCFSRGEQRFSVAEKSSISMMRFSAGLENPRLKPVLWA
jgi:hypothetical protein